MEKASRRRNARRDAFLNKYGIKIHSISLNFVTTFQGAVSQIECRLRTVSDYELKAIAEVLNKPVEWFLEK